jgi:streptogramin lyase
MKLDIATQKLQLFPRPQGLGGNFANGKSVDSKGYVWGSQPNGLFRVDPRTGEYTEFKALTPFGRSYDMAIDRDEKIWFAQLGIDKIGVVDSRTGDTSEVVLPPLDEPITAGDRENGQQAGGGWNMNAPLYGNGPRRMGADPNGDSVWVGLYWAGRLAKIDIHTKKVTEYPIPQGRYAHPYKIVVDKNHMVWFGMANADMLGKFNPVTEQFTMYPLPTRGSNSRHLILDPRAEELTLWVPYTSAQKIAKVTFRTNPAR